MPPTTFATSLMSFSLTPCVFARYAGIALAVVGMAGKNAGCGGHGSGTTGPSRGGAALGVGGPLRLGRPRIRPAVVPRQPEMALAVDAAENGRRPVGLLGHHEPVP